MTGFCSRIWILDVIVDDLMGFVWKCEVKTGLDDVGGAKPQDSEWVEDKPQQSQIVCILVDKQ